MLTGMKQKLYNDAPVRNLQILADNGKRVILNNGRITDLEIDLNMKQCFNHAHPETLINPPVDNFAIFK